MTVFAFLLALWSPAALQATDVRVTPLFWKGQEKPGFKIQCRNDSQSARHRLDYIVKGAALRLDGETREARRLRVLPWTRGSRRGRDIHSTRLVWSGAQGAARD